MIAYLFVDKIDIEILCFLYKEYANQHYIFLQHCSRLSHPQIQVEKSEIILTTSAICLLESRGNIYILEAFELQVNLLSGIVLHSSKGFLIIS